jgi:hypothetical protein
MADWLAMDPTYKGSVPTVRCCEVSGADCNRTMALDAEDCGIPGHVRLRSAAKAEADDVFASRSGRRKPRLTVNEDYDLIRPERNPDADRAMPDLDPATFHTSNVWVGTKIQRGFTAHHGTDAQTAIGEVRFFIQEALANGTYERLHSGFHRLEYKEFAVWLSPDGDTVTGYSTRHYERTPSQVLGGVHSRFGKRRRVGIPREPGPPIPLPELVATFDPATVEITVSALSLYATRAGLDLDDDATEAALRSELTQAATTGSWRVSDRGPTAYVLETPARHWIVAADRGTVLSHYRPDLPPRSTPEKK